jgi:predicted AAA+ superfamily ATPase
LDKGAILEQMTLRSLGAPLKKVYYWRDKSQNEIDFVIEEEALALHLYECKWRYEPIKNKALEVFKVMHKNVSGADVIYFEGDTIGKGIWELD